MRTLRGPRPSLAAAALVLPLGLCSLLASAGSPEGGEAAPAGEGSPAAETRSIALGYKAYKDWDIVLPRETWTPVRDEIPIPHADGGGFAADKVGVLKLRVDTNADGRLDSDVKGNGGFLSLRGRDESGQSFEYAVRISFDGTAYRFASSGAMTGKLAGIQVELVDQDNNGRYDDYGRDAILVGSSRGASLLSRVVNVEDALYEIEVSADGRSLSYRPWTGETAMIEVASKHESRGELVSAVFQNEDGDAFNVVRSGGAMKVPAGSYQFVYGFVRKGGETVNMRTGKMAPVELRNGETRTLEWGGPLVAEFDHSVDGDVITVHPNVAFYGVAGEEYYTFKPDAKSPKIIVADKNSKKVYDEGFFGGC